MTDRQLRGVPRDLTDLRPRRCRLRAGCRSSLRHQDLREGSASEALLFDDLELQVLLEIREWAAARTDRDRDRRQLELVDEAQARQRLGEVGTAMDQDRPFGVPGLQVRDGRAQVTAEDLGRSPI